MTIFIAGTNSGKLGWQRPLWTEEAQNLFCQLGAGLLYLHQKETLGMNLFRSYASLPAPALAC